jgi:ABC-type glycerol-3-phosphate transport system substrate-binding protein
MTDASAEPGETSSALPRPSRRRFLQLGGVTALAGVATAACGAGGSSSSGGSSSLSVVCESGGFAELTKIAQLFKKQTGTKVTLNQLPYNGLYSRVSSELSSGSLSFDLAALDAIWLPAFAPKLAKLDELFTPSVKADLFPATLAEGQINGHYVGMPGWTNVEILFYRKDLFESSSEQKQFKSRYGYDLAPPATWAQFTDAAQFFTKNGIYGTDVKGDVETEYLAHVLQAGSPGVVLDDSGNIIIDNAQHLKALQFYSALDSKYKTCPPGAAQVGWPEAQNLFYQGKTAMTRFWAHLYRQIPATASVHGKVGVAPMIGGSAGIAGVPGPYYLSVPAAGPKNDLAIKFIKFAYDHNDLGIQSVLGLAARKSAFARYAGKPGYESFTPLLKTLSAPATHSRPKVPAWQQIVDTVLVPTIQKSLAPGADHRALLASARTSVASLVK